jgi:outer membrane protein assembly factor BamB
VRSPFPAQPVWTVTLEGALTAPPGFSNSDGYFPIEGDRLAAYDLRTGEHRWTVPARTILPPVAGDGLVFLVEPAAVTARRRTDGAVAWRLPVSDPPTVRLAWEEGWLLMAGHAGTLRAFRGVDGGQVWEADLGGSPSAQPEIDGDRVYVPVADGRVAARLVETGALVWERRLGGTPGALLPFDDRLYVGSTDNYFYCLLRADGQVAWRWRTGADVVGRAAADDRGVYFVSLDNVLRSLTRGGGSLRWRRQLPLRPLSGPLPAGDALVVSGVAPVVPAYARATGNPAGQLTARGELAAPPHVVDGAAAAPTIVIVTRDLLQGASVTAFSRSFEPAVVPLAPLPNPTAAPAPPPERRGSP